MRPVLPTDDIARWVIGPSMKEAYRGLFLEPDIDAVIAGLTRTRESWADDRGEHLARFAAFRGDIAAGYISIGRYKPDHGEVSSLFVHPDHQAGGIGRKLWEHGCATLRGLQLTPIHVWVVANTPAVDFYKRMGCVLADETGTYGIGEKSVRAQHFVLRSEP